MQQVPSRPALGSLLLYLSRRCEPVTPESPKNNLFQKGLLLVLFGQACVSCIILSLVLNGSAPIALLFPCHDFFLIRFKWAQRLFWLHNNPCITWAYLLETSPKDLWESMRSSESLSCEGSQHFPVPYPN